MLIIRINLSLSPVSMLLFWSLLDQVEIHILVLKVPDCSICHFPLNFTRTRSSIITIWSQILKTNKAKGWSVEALERCRSNNLNWQLQSTSIIPSCARTRMCINTPVCTMCAHCTGKNNSFSKISVHSLLSGHPPAAIKV